MRNFRILSIFLSMTFATGIVWAQSLDYIGSYKGDNGCDLTININEYGLLVGSTQGHLWNSVGVSIGKFNQQAQQGQANISGSVDGGTYSYNFFFRNGVLTDFRYSSAVAYIFHRTSYECHNLHKE